MNFRTLIRTFWAVTSTYALCLVAVFLLLVGVQAVLDLFQTDVGIFILLGDLVWAAAALFFVVWITAVITTYNKPERNQ